MLPANTEETPMNRLFAFGLALIGIGTAVFGFILLRQPRANTALAPLPERPKVVAEALDALIQKRFQVVDGQIFGKERASLRIDGHGSITDSLLENADTKNHENALFDNANRQQLAWRYAFLHLSHPLSKLPVTNETGQPEFQKYYQQMQKDQFGIAEYMESFDEFVTNLRDLNPKQELYPWFTPDSQIKAAPNKNIIVKEWKDDFSKKALIKGEFVQRAMQGQAFEVPAGPERLYVRPVRIQQDTCLSCHVGSKKGDTLGAMLYWVESRPRKTN
jgi:hypothetical protein